MMAEVKIEGPRPKPEEPVEDRRQPIDSIREDVFNEVIYGLGVLLRSCQMADYPNDKGISFALDYVKAMAEAEVEL